MASAPLPVARSNLPTWARWSPAIVVLIALLFAGGVLAGKRAETRSVAARHALEAAAVPVAGEIGIVTAAQVLAMPADTYQMIDVRSREAFGLSHATGAISMPESEEVNLMTTLPTDRTLVLYCSCPDEKTSLRAGRTLSTVFHVPHLVVLQGGLDGYAAAGGAMTTNETDSGVESQGCGCGSNAPAYKLWAGNMAAAREAERAAKVETETEGTQP